MAGVDGGSAGARRVCIIGAGWAGIATLRALTRTDDSSDVTVFDRNPDIGGMWYFCENAEIKGAPGYIYKNLRTNGPKQGIVFRDLPHADDIPTFLNPRDVQAYLTRYVDTFSLRKYMQFETEVQSVKKADDDEWTVRVTSKSGEQTHKFDYVIICNGIHRDPYTPDIPGLQAFQGSKVHSSDFRCADDYAVKSVLIIGTSLSMYDICLIVAGVARKVVVSGRSPHRLTLPANCSDRPTVTSFGKTTAMFEDGTEAEFDDIIFCTGFGDFTQIPFLDPSCGISKKNHYVYPLYNNMVNANHPTMMFCGYFDYYYGLVFFEVMADYIETIVTGKTTLPSKHAMLNDIENEFKVFLDGTDPPHTYVRLGSVRQQKLHTKLCEEACIPTPNKFKYQIFDHIMNMIFNERKFHCFRQETYIKDSNGDLRVIKPE